MQWILFLLLGLLGGCMGLNLSEGFNSVKVQSITPDKNLKKPSTSNTLKVMSWNFAYAFGLGSEGKDNYHQMTESEYLQRFNEGLKVLCDAQADVVFLQEVDWGSGRTHHHDQVEAMAKGCGFNHYLKLPSWDHPYIPFPDGLSRHFGRVLSGGAILSRYPMQEEKLYLFPKPTKNPFWYNYFYLYRYVGLATINVAGTEIQLVNVHLEAFDDDEREKQIRIIQEKIGFKEKVIWGGDFNTLPKGASKLDDFEGYEEDDYNGDTTYELVTEKLGFLDALPSEQYKVNTSKYLTFPCTKPDRKLDYLFYRGLAANGFQVIPTKVSDHLPIVSHFSF